MPEGIIGRLDRDLTWRVRFLVAAKLSRGETGPQIRKAVSEVGVPLLCQDFPDTYQQERAVAIVQRALDEAIQNGDDYLSLLRVVRDFVSAIEGGAA